MNFSKFETRFTFFWIYMVSLVLLSFCAGCVSPSYPQTSEELEKVYQTAIRDAEVAENNEISRNLVAIVPYEPGLIWGGEPGKSPVLTVTWTSWDGYDDKIAQSIELTRDVWVTVASELKEFCREVRSTANLTLRMEQLLGLPPDSRKTKVVEMWALPSDIFRPSPDPEISDHEAELEIRVTTQFQKTSQKHIKWFNDTRTKSYGEEGFPWTRLGYTYDWGNPETEVGLSEFVIANGSTVTIRSVSSTEQYCRQ